MENVVWDPGFASVEVGRSVIILSELEGVVNGPERSSKLYRVGGVITPLKARGTGEP